jgi:hypothetical protein
MEKDVIHTNYIKYFVLWGLFILLLVFLMANRQRNNGTFNWMTPLWADQAGYYVYLPAFFIHDFDTGSFPENIEERTGGGFHLDLKNNKVVTRYTCGVAILQAPFFALIHFLIGILGQPQDGFSGLYHQVPNLAGLFFTVLGMIFLWRFLRYYYSKKIAFLTLAALFLGTNLYYYAIDSTGMSHIYSFALFAISAWLTKKLLVADQKKQFIFITVWSIVFSLIILVRPSNILLFPFLFCIGPGSFRELKNRVKRFLKLKYVIILAACFIIVFLPQFLYWKYVSGSFLYYSYEGYGFTNWNSPKIIELWFSPNNGLFLYNPLYFAALAGIFLMIRDKKIDGWVIGLTFFTLSYLFASWFIFSFGCGFGSRNFVEYTVMFSIPMGYLFRRIENLKSIKRTGFVILLVLMVLFNLRIVYKYSRCFQGGDWDFTEYVSFLADVKKYHEELNLDTNSRLSSGEEFSEILSIPLNKLYYLNFTKAVVKSKVEIQDVNSEALLVFALDNPDSLFYWKSVNLKDKIPDSKTGKLYSVKEEFLLPEPMPQNSKISCYIWNRKREYIRLEKLELFLE